MHPKYDDLLYRAKWATISAEEQAMVAAQLGSDDPEVSRYMLIHILGRSGAIQYIPLIELYLESPDDPELSRIALKTLCDYWNRADDYLDHVIRFVGGVDWDTGYIRLMATSIAGEYLASHRNKQLLTLLLSIAQTTNDPILREAAIEALSRGLGHTWNTVLSGIKKPEFAQAVLQQAGKRLVDQGG